MDRKVVGPKIEETLSKSESLEVVKTLGGKAADVETARKAVAKGELPVCHHCPRRGYQSLSR